MPLFTHLNLTIETISPVHIGDGTELLRDYDYVIQNNRTWVIDHEKFLKSCLDPETGMYDDQILSSPPVQFIKQVDYGLSPEDDFSPFRYVMRGTPTNRPIKSHIKTVFGQPYIPGSSIKGLLRTIFVWGMYTARKQEPDLSRLGRSRSWAGQPIERWVMGNTPNTDLFRSLRVSDSDPIGLENQLQVAPVSVYPTGKSGRTGVVVDVEAIRINTTFNTRLTIEEYGFADNEAAQRLDWEGQRVWLNRIVALGHAFNRQRLLDEVEYFQEKSQATAVARFYERLVDHYDKAEENQFIAQIGWGTGWNSKTLNNLLMANDRDFVRLVKDFRLTRFYNDFNAKVRFPNSRHLVQQNGEPVIPTGWVLITVNN